jgi:hypothetical protein
MHTLIWVLIFAGLIAVSVGLFVMRADVVLGWALEIVGSVLVLAGAALIYVRSRKRPPAGSAP